MADEPAIGRWYRNIEDERLFEVVAADEETVEVQHADGDVEEFELEVWYELQLEPAEAPDDLDGPFDGLDDDADGGLKPRGDDLDSLSDPRGRH